MPLGTKEPTLLCLWKVTLSFTKRRNEEIYPKFSRMLETDTRVEVKKLVEATVSCLFLPFQSGQLVILFVELMVIRLWPTWHNAPTSRETTFDPTLKFGFSPDIFRVRE